MPYVISGLVAAGGMAAAMSTADPGEGTGLGMALTYGIIRDHDGNIEVDSFPGAGTEVRIYLPLP